MAGGSKTNLVGDGLGHTREGLGGAGMLAIRTIGVGDATAVAELAGQLGYERSGAQVVRWVEGLAGRKDDQQAFVACVGDEVVGWIEVALQRHLQTDEFALIGGLVVKDGVRGAGIGRELCRRAEKWAADEGVTLMRVTSRSTRERAHKFYERDGYRRVKTSEFFEKLLG